MTRAASPPARSCSTSRTSRCVRRRAGASAMSASTSARARSAPSSARTAPARSSMLNVINGFYHPQEGTITFKGEARRTMRPYRGGVARASPAPSRTSRCSRACRRSTTSCRAARSRCRRGFFWQLIRYRARRARGDRAPPQGRGDHRLPGDRSTSGARPSASCPTACRSGSSSAARWRWSPSCCCSTSRWPA